MNFKWWGVIQHPCGTGIHLDVEHSSRVKPISSDLEEKFFRISPHVFDDTTVSTEIPLLLNPSQALRRLKESERLLATEDPYQARAGSHWESKAAGV